MTTTQRIDLPLNRVEGDLEVGVELHGGVVTDARVSGTMYRGFENMLRGRGALDGLVITPRICGICTTAHLSAAAAALDAITARPVPPAAVRVRNVLAGVEHLQSDIRHGVLTYMADFCNPVYQDRTWYAEAVRRHEPFSGTATLEAIRETRTLIEVLAILAGQWPHSSSIVPGGIASTPSGADLLQCTLLLAGFRGYYERSVIGCTLDRFAAVDSAAALDAWLDESPAHRDSLVGFMISCSRSAGLERAGRGPGAFLSFGGLPAADGGRAAIPAGFARSGSTSPLDHGQVREHVAASWYSDDSGPRHPSDGLTNPYATGQEGTRYSWAKAPRYGGAPAETGPLAQALIAGNGLITDLVATHGPTVLPRQLARILRPVTMLPVVERCVAETKADDEFYSSPGHIPDGEGAGLHEATRGALGHWVRIKDGLIDSYQIITPTAWNASPRDDEGVPGPIEQALVGTPVADPENPIEVGHVVRSFDCCLVCTVHAVRRGGRA
jgi:uptake hydrogenase large subunit